MTIHIYFNIAKLIYSFSSRRDLGFVLLEAAGSIATIALARYGFYSLQSFVYTLVPENVFLARMLLSSVWGMLFILFALFSRLLIPKHPRELAPIEENTKPVAIGVVDLYSIVMLGISYTTILICQSYPSLSYPILDGRIESYYKMYYEELSYLFGRSIDVLMILGTILAVSMIMLWGAQFWKKTDSLSRSQHTCAITASVKTVITFLAICISIIVWVSVPLHLRMTMLKDMLP